MLFLIRRYCFIAVFLFNLCAVLGKDILLPKCVKIVSINTPLDDPTKAAQNYGLHADQKRAVLSDTPGIFKVHKGLLQENGTVSLEALFHPGYFLRHKNYHFHLEKEDNSSMFYKDATFFILKVTDHPALYAFELYSHPTWFMRHLKHKPYGMVLRKVNESSKEVMDSTFFLVRHRCHANEKNETNAEKKTVLVGGGTFIDTADEPDEETEIRNAQENDLHAEDFDKSFSSKDPDDLGDSIRIHTEDDQKDGKEPIKIHTESDVKSDDDSDSGKAGADDSSEDIVKEVEEAFRISQSTNNSTYLEKIEKDIQDKVNSIAAIASEGTKNQGDAKKNHKNKDKPVDNIEIHTETDRPSASQTIDEKKPKEKLSKVDEEERTQRVEVLDPVIDKTPEKGKTSSDESVVTEINKDIVVTGKPKLNENVFIDSTFHNNHPHKTNHKGRHVHTENITGFNIDDVSPIKSHLHSSSGHVGSKPTTHAQQHKAYHDYAEAHKVLNKNIEKLKNVLKAIEDEPRLNEQGIEMVKKNAGQLGQKQRSNNSAATTILQLSGTPLVTSLPPYLPPAGYKVLNSQSSTQTTVTKLPGPPTAQKAPPNNVPLVNNPPITTSVGKANLEQDVGANQSQLAHTSGVLLGAQSVKVANAPGLHVIQGNGNQLNADISTQASADVVDHIANELVDHNVVSQANNNGASHWVNRLHPHNKTLQETFKELRPDDTKIFYLGECEDRFPKACEEWAAQRYCLTFGELMKRYCRKACKLCNHVLATGFTPCDKTCGGGVRLRMIKVNNRQVLQRRSCNIKSCPINGGYAPYSEWSECSVTCGEGVRYRHRSCTNPKPQFGGHDCTRFGPPVDTMPCVKGCKGFNPSKHHSSNAVEFPKGKNHPADHLDPDEFPEYKAEESNPKTTETGDGHDFQWPGKHQRKKPLVLDHVHKNLYKHRDHNGKSHYLQVDEEQNPDGQLQTHVVRYQGHQVARMQCGPSKLLEYHRHAPNIPSTGYKRSNPYKMFEGGEIVYDKDGVPADTTKNIVEAFDSPYKIILQRNKNNQMKVMEECIESDASVNPDNDLKNDAQAYAGTTSLGSEQHSFPVTSTEGTTSNHFTENGLYEYKYQDIGQGVDDDKTLDKDVSDQLTRVINKEAAGITQRFLRNQDAKPTLREELAAEKEEAWREKKYEDYVARRSKATSGS